MLEVFRVGAIAIVGNCGAGKIKRPAAASVTTFTALGLSMSAGAAGVFSVPTCTAGSCITSISAGDVLRPDQRLIALDV